MIVSMLLGAALGMRFKVFVLFPAIFASAALIVGAAAAHGSAVWSAVLSIALSATGLQIGFFGGVAARFVVAAAWAPRLPDVQPAPAQGPRPHGDQPAAATSGSAS